MNLLVTYNGYRHCFQVLKCFSSCWWNFSHCFVNPFLFDASSSALVLHSNSLRIVDIGLVHLPSKSVWIFLAKSSSLCNHFSNKIKFNSIVYSEMQWAIGDEASLTSDTLSIKSAKLWSNFSILPVTQLRKITKIKIITWKVWINYTIFIRTCIFGWGFQTQHNWTNR